MFAHDHEFRSEMIREEIGVIRREGCERTFTKFSDGERAEWVRDTGEANPERFSRSSPTSLSLH